MISCRKCGGSPVKVIESISPGAKSIAIHCSNPDCYNDTHWQSSHHEAHKIWSKNPCASDIRGGQGKSSDDDNIVNLFGVKPPTQDDKL